MTEIQDLFTLEQGQVERVLAGDSEAADGLLRALQGPAYNLALRMLQDHSLAEDACQECLLRVITRLSSFRGESKFSTWAISVCIRCILDFRGGLARRMHISSDAFGRDLAEGLVDGAGSDPELQHYLGQVKLGCGRAMLLTLDIDHRFAYVLGEILGYDHQACAQALGVAAATFRKRLSRARQRVRAVLDQYCGVVQPSAACHCAGRVRRAEALGRLDPRDAQGLDVAALTVRIRGLSELQGAAAFHRAEGQFVPPESLLRQLRAVISGDGPAAPPA